MNLLRWLLKLNKKKDCVSKTHGSAALEFALVSPAFFLLILGIFEIGTVMYLQAVLDLAVLQVSRFGRTGQGVTGQTPQQTAAGLVSSYTFGLVKPANLTLTATPYPSFSSVPTNSQVLSQKLNNGQVNLGATSQIVLYTLTYNWTFYTTLVGNLLSPSGNGKITLISSIVIQNEPF